MPISRCTAALFEALRSGGNVQPNKRARVRTLPVARLRAAAALKIEAPWPASALMRSSSSAVHGRQMGRIIQWPKIIAPIVNTAAPIQIQMAAFFSEMVGVDFMTD